MRRARSPRALFRCYQSALISTSPSSINGLIAKADSIDAVLVVNLVGSRTGWTDLSGSCRNYNDTKYDSLVQRLQGNATLTDAIARRRVVVYLVDEPHIDEFCGTVTPTVVNNMGLLVKSIWPGAITIVQASAETMADGWDGSGALSSTFWTGVDYGWGQFSGNHTPSAGETPAQFYAREKSELAAVNLGMIPGFNVLDGGSNSCWDYQNTGSSSGRIAGTFTQGGVVVPGQFLTCASGTQGNTRWFTPDTELLAAIDGIYNDPDAPLFIGWTHVYSTFSPAQSTFAGLEERSDVVAALNYWISKGASRTTWNGWRIAK